MAVGNSDIFSINRNAETSPMYFSDGFGGFVRVDTGQASGVGVPTRDARATGGYGRDWRSGLAADLNGVRAQNRYCACHGCYPNVDFVADPPY